MDNLLSGGVEGRHAEPTEASFALPQHSPDLGRSGSSAPPAQNLFSDGTKVERQASGEQSLKPESGGTLSRWFSAQLPATELPVPVLAEPKRDSVCNSDMEKPSVSEAREMHKNEINARCRSLKLQTLAAGNNLWTTT